MRIAFLAALVPLLAVAMGALGHVTERVAAIQASAAVAKDAAKRPTGTCTRYASPSGSDAHRGTLRRPFRTPQRLVDALRAGGVGCLRGGTYGDGEIVLRFTSSRVTITSYPGERALLRGIVVVRSGANSDQLVSVSVDGDGSQNTIQVYGADFTLRGSDITNTWRGRSCLMLGDASAGTAVRPVIRGNRFHECGSPANGNLDHGIYASHVSNGLITENVFWNSAGYAIQLYPSAQGTVFSHNVVDGIGTVARGGVIIGGDTSSSPSSGNTIEYNVIAYAADYGISSWWGGSVGSNNIARNNCLYGNGQGQVENRGGLLVVANRVGNPLLVNRGTHQVTLRPESRCLRTVGYQTLGVGSSAG